MHVAVDCFKMLTPQKKLQTIALEDFLHVIYGSSYTYAINIVHCMIEKPLFWKLYEKLWND